MVCLRDLLRLASSTYTRHERSGKWRRLRDHGSWAHGSRCTLWIDDQRGDCVLGFRGTASLGEVFQDLKLLLGFEPRAWRHGRAAIELARRELPRGGRLLLTGHSIGGAFASALGAEQGLETVTFNAPGMLQSLRRSSHAGAAAPWLSSTSSHVVDVSIRDDWIRLLSGPAVGSRVLIGQAPSWSMRGHGPQALSRTLLRGLRGDGLGFIARSIRRHVIAAFRPFADGGHELPWGRELQSPARLLARDP